MIRGTTFHACVPIMLEPDHVSPMLSQVLFGEEFLVLDRTGDWLSIRLDTDDIEGWIMKQGVELREIENEQEMNPGGPVSLVSLPSATILDLTLGQQWIIMAYTVASRNNTPINSGLLNAFESYFLKTQWQKNTYMTIPDPHLLPI